VSRTGNHTKIGTRINAATHQVITATLEFGEHRDTEGYLRAMRVADAERDDGGGAVLPFHRPPEPSP